VTGSQSQRFFWQEAEIPEGEGMAHRSLLTVDEVDFLSEFLEEVLEETRDETGDDALTARSEDRPFEKFTGEPFEMIFPVLGHGAEALSFRDEIGKGQSLAPLHGASRRPAMFNFSAAGLVGFDDYFVQALGLTEDLEAIISAFDRIDDWNGTPG
jgi:hypothetical protein